MLQIVSCPSRFELTLKTNRDFVSALYTNTKSIFNNMKCVKSSLSSVVKTEIILEIMQQNVLKMHEVTSRVSENIRMLYLKTFNDTNDMPKLDTKLFTSGKRYM